MTTTETKSRYGPDSKDCWAVAISVSLFVYFAMGTIKSESVWYVGLIEMLALQRREASMPPTLGVMFSQLSGPAYGILSKWFSERALLVSASFIMSVPVMLCYFAKNVQTVSVLLGVFHGFGVASAEVIPFVILTRHFDKYRGSVISLLYVLTALSGFIMPVLTETLRQIYGFRNCILLIGAINLHLLACCIITDRAFWLKRRKPSAPNSIINKRIAQDKLAHSESFHLSSCKSKGMQHTVFVSEEEPLIPEKAKSPKSEIMRNIKSLLSFTFIHITLSRAITVFVYATFVLIMMDYGKDSGLSSFLAVTMVTSFSAGDLVSRLLSGYLVDSKLISCAGGMLFGFLVQGATLILITFFKYYGVLLIGSFVMGLTGGGRMLFCTVMVTEEFETSSIGLNLGVMNFFTGITIFLRPPVVGFVRDVLGRYDDLLVIFAFINFACCISWGILTLKNYRRK